MVRKIQRLRPRSGRAELVSGLGALVDQCERATGEGPRGVLVTWPDGSAWLWWGGRFVRADGRVDVVHRYTAKAAKETGT
jgi:hypothetical protein